MKVSLPGLCVLVFGVAGVPLAHIDAEAKTHLASPLSWYEELTLSRSEMAFKPRLSHENGLESTASLLPSELFKLMLEVSLPTVRQSIHL